MFYESIKYVFTADEIRELGETLARESQTTIDLQAQKAARTAEISALIKAVQKRVADLAMRINNGYELREVECVTLLETPILGMKRIVRVDTQETVREEAMTRQEMQAAFHFQEPDTGK